MEHPSPMVSHVLPLHLLGSDGPAVSMDAELRYRVEDPLAVEAFFGDHADVRVRWVFARDLLVAGLRHRAGLGDVTVWPSTDGLGRPVVMLRLSSPDGTALMEADASAVGQFLDDTARLVPLGREAEHLDIDATLMRLLAD